MDLPQPFTLVLPVLAANLAAYLKDDGLPRWLNYLIVAVFFVAAVWASLSSEGHLTGDAVKDATIVIVECLAIFQLLQPVMARSTALARSPLMALVPSSHPGPLSAFSRQGMASSAFAPITPRASLLSSGQAWIASEPTKTDPSVTMPLPVVSSQPGQDQSEQTPPPPPAAS